MQVASTIAARLWASRKVGSTGPKETVRVKEAQIPCRRPTAQMVARPLISAALKVGRR